MKSKENATHKFALFSERNQQKLKSKKFWSGLIFSFLRYAMLICLAYIILFPIFKMVTNAFMSSDDLLDKTVTYIPKFPSLENFQIAIDAMHFQTSVLNSLKITLLVSALQLISCTLIGYGFGRYKFFGKKFFYAFVIASILIPPQTIMISQFLQFRYMDFFGLITMLRGKTGLIDTSWPFLMLGATGFGIKNGLFIYLFSEYFRGLPKVLEEAGYVDGAGAFRIFFRIMLPNAVPMMTTVLLFSVSWQWTDYYYSNLFLTSQWTLPMALSAIQTYNNTTLSPAVIGAANNAGMILIILPLLVMYLFTQKLFIQGIEKSGIVG